MNNIIKKFIDSIPFDSDVKNLWIDMFQEELISESKKVNVSHEDCLRYLKETKDKNMSGFIDENQASNSIHNDNLDSYDDTEKEYEISTWCFVGPHSDMPDTIESKRNSTGYNGPRYIAFYFFESHNHVLQSDFRRDDAEWKEDNIPKKELLIDNENIFFLDTHETHALGYSNNEHFKYIKNDKKHLIELYENNSERNAIALSISYKNIPTKKDILNDFENIMKHMLDYSNVPKPL